MEPWRTVNLKFVAIFFVLQKENSGGIIPENPDMQFLIRACDFSSPYGSRKQTSV